MYVCSIWKRDYPTAEGQIRDLRGVKRRGAFWDNHMQFTILLQASSSLHLHVQQNYQHDEIDACFRMQYIYDLINEFVNKKASFTHKKKQGAGCFEYFVNQMSLCSIQISAMKMIKTEHSYLNQTLVQLNITHSFLCKSSIIVVWVKIV